MKAKKFFLKEVFHHPHLTPFLSLIAFRVKWKKKNRLKVSWFCGFYGELRNRDFRIVVMGWLFVLDHEKSIEGYVRERDILN